MTDNYTILNQTPNEILISAAAPFNYIIIPTTTNAFNSPQETLELLKNLNYAGRILVDSLLTKGTTNDRMLYLNYDKHSDNLSNTSHTELDKIDPSVRRSLKAFYQDHPDLITNSPALSQADKEYHTYY